MMSRVKRGVFRVIKTGAGVAVVSAASVPAFAAIDTTDAIAEITAAGTAIGAVGGAILVLAGISLAIRWVKATFF